MKAAIIPVLIIILLFFMAYYSSAEDIIIKVVNKERITTQEGNGKYLIFTENEVFENTDDLFLLKFNSSDLYNQLKVNKNYKVKVIGWRIPFFSMYRNIIKIYNEEKSK